MCPSARWLDGALFAKQIFQRSGQLYIRAWLIIISDVPGPIPGIQDLVVTAVYSV